MELQREPTPQKSEATLESEKLLRSTPKRAADMKLRFVPAILTGRMFRSEDSAKTSGRTQRQRYDDEILAIRSRFGGLDDMRKALNLSRRQICQTLLVDPSAWTRWTADSESAPAHVYKTLALIMEQNQRDPQVSAEMKVNSRLNEQGKASEHLTSAVSKTQERLFEVENELHELRTEIKSEVNSQIEAMKKSLNETTILSFGWKLLLIINIVLVLYVLFR